MDSPEGKISNSPTKVLFLPKLLPSISDWKILKTHFSMYGDVTNVVVNPQQRWCTVSFKTVADAEAAKSDGCVWKSKALESHYWSSAGKPQLSLDRRSAAEDIFTYSDLDALWSDEDVENFGVVNTKLSTPVAKQKEKLRSAIVEELKKKKLDISVKKAKSKIKLYSEKIDQLREAKLKEGKKKVKEDVLEIGKQKRLTAVKKKKDAVVRESASLPSVDQLNPSLKDKFIILEERDKLIRKNFVKSSNVKCRAIIGTCPDMCPEKERIMREFRRLVSFYEMVPGTQLMDHNLAIKAYVRSSADQEEPLPHELRPEPVLSMTMSYLINEIMPLIEDPDVNASEWYDFCWDRLRGIRKDIIQQQLCDLETVTIIEQCARFHICCYDRFSGADPLVFDEKINTENLSNCLQTLRHMYIDLSKENIKCPNEVEFTAYWILLSMKTGDLMATYQQYSEDLQKVEWIQSTVKIYLAFNNLMYSQFFKLVKKSTYLDTCLLQRYFYTVRVAALQAIARAYCPPNKGGSIPLKHMMKILKFDTPEDTRLFCEGHGISLKDNKKDFRLYRNDFFFPENKISIKNSSSLVTEKRIPLVEAVVGNSKYNLRDYKNHKVHSSFTKDGKLNEFALDASDQKNKSSEMCVDVVDNMEQVEDDNNVKIDFENVEKMCDNKGKGGDRFTEMDVDADQMQSVQEEENFSFSNNDLVSRKQHVSSAFKFQLKHPVQISSESDLEKEQTAAGPFKFSLSRPTTPKFDNRNVQSSAFSYQLMPNQFSLKFDDGSVEGDCLPASCDKLSSVLLADYEDSQSVESYPQSHLKTGSFDMKILKRRQSRDNKRNKKPFDNNSAKLKNAVKSVLATDVSNDAFSLPNTLAIGSQSSDVLKNKDENKVDFVKTTSDTVLPLKRGFSDEPATISNIIKVNLDNDGDKNFEVLKSNFNFVDALMSDKSMYYVKEKENASENIGSTIEKQKLYQKEAEEKEKTRKLRLKEKQAMNMLRKDLRRRMKAATARHFIRKWKRKVEKIKRNKIEFPLLISVPADQHVSVWGSAFDVCSLSGCSLLNRLKVKRQNVKVMNTILDDCMQSDLPYLGHEIANIIANGNNFKLNIRDFNVPLCWKLVVSVPFLKDDEFFTNKFKSFIKRLFYKTENSVLGSVVKEMASSSSSENGIPVYYCVHLVFGNDFRGNEHKITSMSGVLFIVIDGIENYADNCKRFKNLVMSDLNTKPVPVALMKIGKEYENRFLKIFNERLVKNKIYRSIEEYWCDFTSVNRVVKFLSENVRLFSSVRVYTLSSLLKQIAEHIYDFLMTAATISEQFKSALTDPNIVINFYNLFFNTLQNMLLDSDFDGYDVVPVEFKQYVEYCNKLNESHHADDVTFDKSNRSDIVKAFSKIKLRNIKPWPPKDEHHLLNIFGLYLESINSYQILPRVFRVVDYKDDNVDFLKFINNGVSWVSVIDLILNNILQLYRDETEKCIVICDENNVSELLRFDFCFKLFPCINDK